MCLAIPAKLESIEPWTDPIFRTGTVNFGGIGKKISLAMLSEAKPGDYVLIHAGVALTIVSEEEARKVFDYLKQTGELEE